MRPVDRVHRVCRFSYSVGQQCKSNQTYVRGFYEHIFVGRTPSSRPSSASLRRGARGLRAGRRYNACGLRATRPVGTTCSGTRSDTALDSKKRHHGQPPRSADSGSLRTVRNPLPGSSTSQGCSTAARKKAAPVRTTERCSQSRRAVLRKFCTASPGRPTENSLTSR